MLELKNISKTYGKKTIVLDNVNLLLENGKTLALMGKSGTGKSTLAKIILMLEQQDCGKIFLNGEEINHKDSKKVSCFKKSVQYLSQHPESFLDPHLKLGRSILEVRKVIINKNLEQDLMKLLYTVKLNAAILDRYPHQVSGGEIQRAALCRALLMKPEILVLDEATSMLDVSVQAQILNLLKDIQNTTGMSYLLITHDDEVAKWMTDTIFLLEGGKMIDIS